MTDARTTRLKRGLLPLISFALLTAALDVFAGNQLQVHSPATVAAISFTLATVFFLGGAMIRQGVAATLRPLRTHRHDVIILSASHSPLKEAARPHTASKGYLPEAPYA